MSLQIDKLHFKIRISNLRLECFKNMKIRKHRGGVSKVSYLATKIGRSIYKVHSIFRIRSCSKIRRDLELLTKVVDD